MRKVIPFNENWSFRKEDTGLPLTLPADWETVTLPHTWNAVDGQDGKGSYYRGACWYAKEFPTPSGLCDKEVFPPLPRISRTISTRKAQGKPT